MDDTVLLAQYFVDAVPGNRDVLDRHVIDTFAAVGDPDPARAHELLAELPIDEFWTTSYDPLVERAVGDAHVFANDEELATAGVEPGRRRINKMHGSIDPPGPLILTRDDYEQYPTTHPRFWQLLQAQFLTKTSCSSGSASPTPIWSWSSGSSEPWRPELGGEAWTCRVPRLTFELVSAR